MHVRETIYHSWRKSTQKYYLDNEFKKINSRFYKMIKEYIGGRYYVY